jgi:hypothetical protein
LGHDRVDIRIIKQEGTEGAVCASEVTAPAEQLEVDAFCLGEKGSWGRTWDRPRAISRESDSEGRSSGSRGSATGRAVASGNGDDRSANRGTAAGSGRRGGRGGALGSGGSGSGGSGSALGGSGGGLGSGGGAGLCGDSGCDDDLGGRNTLEEVGVQ